jgi:3,4-dihydroxy 2-butanone 4-phosphate synthase/GTP cyclohydrolase II
MKAIVDRGHGYIVYMRGHEGRGIGLSQKIKAYQLQEKGMNTYEADQHLGWDRDLRSYEDSIAILRYFKVNDFDFFTNNPSKKKALEEAGFNFNVYGIPSKKTKYNAQYLSDKIHLSKHTISTILP